MKIVNNMIFCKSVPEIYLKEKSGEKSNTVRYISNDDVIEQIEGFTGITIENTDTGENFTRVLSDVSTTLVNGVRVFIFSWR